MPEQKGIHDLRTLPDPEFDGMCESIILPPELKDRMLAQAALNFTARRKLQEVFMPLHAVILLVVPRDWQDVRPQRAHQTQSGPDPKARHPVAQRAQLRQHRQGQPEPL
jgi:hypothetical protein